jgi:hypothetical protein
MQIIIIIVQDVEDTDMRNYIDVEKRSRIWKNVIN